MKSMITSHLFHTLPKSAQGPCLVTEDGFRDATAAKEQATQTPTAQGLFYRGGRSFVMVATLIAMILFFLIICRFIYLGVSRGGG